MKALRGGEPLPRDAFHQSAQFMLELLPERFFPAHELVEMRIARVIGPDAAGFGKRKALSQKMRISLRRHHRIMLAVYDGWRVKIDLLVL